MATTNSKRGAHLILTLFSIALLSHSCSFYTKDNYLSDFTSFVNDVENNYITYSTEDWEASDAEFLHYTETLFEEHIEALTKEDKIAIGKLVARFSVIRAKGYGKQLEDGLEDAKSYIKGFLEALSEETNINENQ